MIAQAEGKIGKGSEEDVECHHCNFPWNYHWLLKQLYGATRTHLFGARRSVAAGSMGHLPFNSVDAASQAPSCSGYPLAAGSVARRWVDADLKHGSSLLATAARSSIHASSRRRSHGGSEGLGNAFYENLLFNAKGQNPVGSTYDAVHKIQDGYKITPLSQWGKSPQPVVVKVDPDIDMKTPPKAQVDTMPAGRYFSYAAELLRANLPHITDRPIIARLISGKSLAALRLTRKSAE